MFAWEVGQPSEEKGSGSTSTLEEFKEWRHFCQQKETLKTNSNAAFFVVGQEKEKGRYGKVADSRKGDEAQTVVEAEKEFVLFSGPLRSSEGGGNLSRVSVHELLQGVLTVGEDGDFEKALAKVSAAEAANPQTFQDVLRLTMLYHQVLVHFSGDVTSQFRGKVAASVALLSGHALGSYADILIRTASTVGSNDVEELRELSESTSSQCYLPRYVYGLHQWKHTGNMQGIVQVAKQAQGENGESGEKDYCPEGLLSWILWRVAMHNVKIFKRDLRRLRTSEIKNQRANINAILVKASVADTDGQGARKQAQRVMDELKNTT